jgi:hypothetical protein
LWAKNERFYGLTRKICDPKICERVAKNLDGRKTISIYDPGIV